MREVRVRPVFLVRRVQRRNATNVQHLRSSLLEDLKLLFDMAMKNAHEGEPQRSAEEAALNRALGKKSEEKDTKLKVKQRQIWARIAAYTAQVMNSLTKSYDESQITEELQRLERMVSEAVAKEKDRGPAAAS